MPRRAEKEVLETLYDKGELTWGELLRKAGLSKGALSYTLKNLMKGDKIVKEKTESGKVYKLSHKNKRFYEIDAHSNQYKNMKLYTEEDFDELLSVKMNILIEGEISPEIKMEVGEELSKINDSFNIIDNKIREAQGEATPKLSLIAYNWVMEQQLHESYTLVETEDGFTPALDIIKSLSPEQRKKYQNDLENALEKLRNGDKNALKSFPEYPGLESKAPLLPSDKDGWKEMWYKILRALRIFQTSGV